MRLMGRKDVMRREVVRIIMKKRKEEVPTS